MHHRYFDFVRVHFFGRQRIALEGNHEANTPDQEKLKVFFPTLEFVSVSTLFFHSSFFFNVHFIVVRHERGAWAHENDASKMMQAAGTQKRHFSLGTNDCQKKIRIEDDEKISKKNESRESNKLNSLAIYFRRQIYAHNIVWPMDSQWWHRHFTRHLHNFIEVFPSPSANIFHQMYPDWQTDRKHFIVSAAMSSGARHIANTLETSRLSSHMDLDANTYTLTCLYLQPVIFGISRKKDHWVIYC